MQCLLKKGITIYEVHLTFGLGNETHTSEAHLQKQCKRLRKIKHWRCTTAIV